VDIDLLRQRVKVKMEEHPETIGTYNNADIAVLRNGKAKKTDPPIPADLAPISGGGTGRRFRKELQEDAPALESIKFRYSEETIAEEQVVQPEQPGQQGEQRHNRRHKNRRHKSGNKPAGEAARPQQNNAPAPKGEAAPAQNAEGAAQKKNYHHRRRHKKPAAAKEQ
jgi:hypothetical protein